MTEATRQSRGSSLRPFAHGFRQGTTVLLLLIGGLVAGVAAGAERALSEYTFREYQAEMPYIRRIVFEHWDHKRFGPAYFWAEGAFQPRGWYLHYPTNSPYFSKRFVCGLSTESEWEYGAEWRTVIYGPPDVWAQPDQSIEFSQLEVLLTAAYLGIPRLPGDFAWKSDTEFEFFLSGWGKCAGRITRSDAGRPLEVEYGPAERGRDYPKGRITYFYRDGRSFPPERFTVTYESRNGTREERFVWHEVALGLDPAAREGYRLKTFLRPTDEIAEVQYISNNVRYVVLPDGTMKPYQSSQPPPPPRSPGSSAAGIALVAGAIVVGVVLFRLYGRKERRTQDKPKKP
ncbi:MAG: hypothetical protein D6766_08570 [Verrucomicrobia bacterium]|nr:MAG: hypothetical protein D6766_08570 [Verrucomicrobiota bacterium]